MNSAVFGDSPLVLVYHSVGTPGGFDNVGISTFEDHVEWLSKNCKIVDLEEIFWESDEKKNVVITFDDGLRSFYEKAVPILRKYNAPATVFVVSAAVRNDPPPTVEYIVKERLKSTESLMTHDQLLALTEDPLFTIGSHSATHKKLPNIINTDQIIKEVRGSKARLESELKVSIDRFSYPNYRYNKISVKIVSECYSYAVKGDGGSTLIDGRTDPYLVPRVSGARSLNQIRVVLIDLTRRVYGTLVNY